MSTQRTTTAYLDGINAATAEAGVADNGWNIRFRGALTKYDLTLSPAKPPDRPEYPNGEAFFAPVPYGEVDGWPVDTYVAWLEDM